MGSRTRLKKKAIAVVTRLGTISALKKGTRANMVPIRIKMKNMDRKSLRASLKSSFILQASG
jgi:hypothetical protein